MKRTRRMEWVGLLAVLALVMIVSPVFAQGGCGPMGPDHMPGPTPTPSPDPTPYSGGGWGCYPPSAPYTPGTSNGPAGGWCGLYNTSSFGSLGMVSTQAVAMHILFPALAPHGPISQLADWISKPERVDHTNITGQIDYYFIMTYDVSGRLVKVELFNATDALIAYTECEYGTGGQLVKTLSYGPTGAELSYADFIYNAAGQLVSVQTYVGGLPVYTLGCLYNRRGQMSRVSQYDPAGTLQMYTNNLYYGSRGLKKTVSYSAGKAVLETKTYAYNASGQIQTVCDYISRRHLNGYSSYARNTSGQPTHTYFYNGSNTQTGGSFCYLNLL